MLTKRVLHSKSFWDPCLLVSSFLDKVKNQRCTTLHRRLLYIWLKLLILKSYEIEHFLITINQQQNQLNISNCSCLPRFIFHFYWASYLFYLIELCLVFNIYSLQLQCCSLPLDTRQRDQQHLFLKEVCATNFWQLVVFKLEIGCFQVAWLLMTTRSRALILKGYP